MELRASGNRRQAFHDEFLADLPFRDLLPVNVPCLFELISSLLIQQEADL